MPLPTFLLSQMAPFQLFPNFYSWQYFKSIYQCSRYNITKSLYHFKLYIILIIICIVRNQIETSLRTHFSSYHQAIEHIVLELATSLYSNGMISSLTSPTTDKILDEFILSLSSLHTILELTQRYKKFLNCLHSINKIHSLFWLLLTELVQDFKIIQESESKCNS